MTSDGDLLMMPINGRFLKKYYPWLDPFHDQDNITPLIKTFKWDHTTINQYEVDRTLVVSKKNQGYEYSNQIIQRL